MDCDHHPSLNVLVSYGRDGSDNPPPENLDLVILGPCVKPVTETGGEDLIHVIIRHVRDERRGLLATWHVLKEKQQLVEGDGRLGVAGEAGVSSLELGELCGCQGEES